MGIAGAWRIALRAPPPLLHAAPGSIDGNGGVVPGRRIHHRIARNRSLRARHHTGRTSNRGARRATHGVIARRHRVDRVAAANLTRRILHRGRTPASKIADVRIGRHAAPHLLSVRIAFVPSVAAMDVAFPCLAFTLIGDIALALFKSCGLPRRCVRFAERTFVNSVVVLGLRNVRRADRRLVGRNGAGNR